MTRQPGRCRAGCDESHVLSTDWRTAGGARHEGARRSESAALYALRGDTVSAAHAWLAEIVSAAEAEPALAARLRNVFATTSPDESLLLAAAALAAGTTPRALRSAIGRGELVASRTGRHLAIRRSDLEAFIRSRRVAPRSPTAPTSDIRARAYADHAAVPRGRR